MNRNISKGVLAALLCILLCCIVMADNQEINYTDISAHPVQFIENVGQAHEDILYQVKSSEFSFDFTKDALLVSGPSGDCEECGENVTTPVIVTVADAEENVTVEAFDKLDGYANFLIGKNESDWQQYVPGMGASGIAKYFLELISPIPESRVFSNGSSPSGRRRSQCHPTHLWRKRGVIAHRRWFPQVVTSFGNLTERAPILTR